MNMKRWYGIISDKYTNVADGSTQFSRIRTHLQLQRKEGYKKSIILSKEYNLYRQDFCGCIYSKRDKIID